MQSLLSHPFVLLLIAAAAAATTYRPYLDCAAAPFPCGNLSINVSYPFRLYNRLDYCGFPGFILTCTDNNSTMMINIGNYEYQVKSVDYLNHLLTVVGTDLTAQSCPRPYKNTTLDRSLYMYTDREQNLTVFINCRTSSPETAALYEIKCLSQVNGLRSYYALDNQSLPAGLSASCNSTVVVPVDRTAVELMVNSMPAGFGEGLREGFTVRWMPDKGWCRDCKNSGGICGYNYSSPGDPTCYCPYGLDLRTCSSDGRASSHVAEIVAPILGVILLGLLLWYLWWRSKRRHGRRRVELEVFRPQSSKDLPFIDLAIIQEATCNFSDANKLGEGGFGAVYKGTLNGGREIAVKRLSTKSKQGTAEFKNEVSLIAKLQHKNLVRMLGYCVEREEKLLIYEYLPNRSLDVILFDPTKRSQLVWRRRHDIVAGIARGLLYLHEDSLLKVIHRDLKASNVLLDRELRPKISDFGMARIFEADENEATNTNRVVGTYGYMAPEYAMDGVFSVKSDVYSFGVLLLEILSGQKNGRSHFEQHGQTLLRSAWQLWSEGRAMQLVDPLLGDSYPASEALKFIHIGLLCVQENAEERPTMSSIVLMLQSEKKVPQPTQPPTFFLQKKMAVSASGSVSDLSSSSKKAHSTNSQYSINNVTNSVVAPR